MDMNEGDALILGDDLIFLHTILYVLSFDIIIPSRECRRRRRIGETC